jgi:alpha-galactosidase
MLLGIYASPFNQTCGQDVRIGSSGHETTDARTFAAWGVDYLKYDWCRSNADHADQVKVFTAMRNALRATGRHIFYSINPNSSGPGSIPTGPPSPTWPAPPPIWSRCGAARSRR